MWTLVIERSWYFERVLPGRRRRCSRRGGRAAITAPGARARSAAAMISRLNGAMTANLLLLRVLVPLAPLLGLIGTVSGMLEVFDSMALRGSADARTMASGVSHAMICTLTGLAVSITGSTRSTTSSRARGARPSCSPTGSSLLDAAAATPRRGHDESPRASTSRRCSTSS